MGDTGINTRDQQSESSPGTDNNRTSMERLHEAKPSENISINSITTEESKEKPITTNNDNNSQQDVFAKIETVFEKLDINSDKSDSTTEAIVAEGEKVAADQKVEMPKLELEVSEKASLKINNAEEVSNTKSNDVHRSESGASGKVYKQRDMSSTIFPAGIMGCRDNAEPARRFLDAKEACLDYAGHLENTPRKRPPSEKKESRNPLTGVGVHPDDAKRLSSRKKDGNPLLGSGYDDTKLTVTRAKNPPGGFSKGLW